MKIVRRQFKADVPAVAQGDIAFLLLIFLFILAKTQDDSHIKWKPANVEQATVLERAPVRIVVDEEGKTFLNGQQVAEAVLVERITKGLENAEKDKRFVLLKIDRDAKAYQFEPVIQAASEAGGTLVHVLKEDLKKS